MINALITLCKRLYTEIGGVICRDNLCYRCDMSRFRMSMLFYLQSAYESCILTFDVKAGSSIRQSSGLQIRRLQVRFLSRLPTHHHLQFGEMAEWSIALVLKTRELTFRGFESLSLLHSHTGNARGGRIVGLVRRFAKPLRKQFLREFESLPPRQSPPTGIACWGIALLRCHL